MKRFLVGTLFGRVAMSARSALELGLGSIKAPEQAGTVANDQMAAKLLVRFCQPGKVFIDVGAHIGSVIAEVRHHCPTVRIEAVEAIPEKAEHLRHKFPGVTVHECAVGESHGNVSFFVLPNQSGFSSLGKPSGKAEDEVVEIQVPMRTLDDLVTPGETDVVKIDVEGAELGVLRGGSRLIESDRPTILFESGPPENHGLGYSKEDLWRWFDERDYEVVVPNRVAHSSPPLSLEGFLEAHHYPRRTTNYFAIFRNRRAEIRDRARALLQLGPG